MEWFSVALRCHHPAWDPNQVSSALGMTPKIAWGVGELRRTPDGELLGGKYENTYWCSQDLDGFSGDPVGTLAKYLDILERKRSSIQAIVGTGGRLEFFVGWGLGGPSDGEELGSGLLRRLGDLSIDLSLCVYEQIRGGSRPSEPTVAQGPLVL